LTDATLCSTAFRACDEQVRKQRTVTARMADEESSKEAGASWSSRSRGIEVGDRVCYSQRFLQSTGQYTGDVPFARGIVTALKSLGSLTLAEIDWDNKDMPARVPTSNLSRVTDKGILDR
jgi:hypothetical protein